jgi:ABC-type amino acid transport substrate-binding protein
MKSIAAMVATVGLALVVSVTSVRAGCLDDIKKAGVIKSGNGIMGTKPSVWQNPDGSYSGFEWELFQEMAKRMGVGKPEYEITEWTSLIPGLKADRWDIIFSGMAVTQEREQGAGITYSDPYFMLYDYVIVPKDSPIKTLADLKGKTLASTLGTMDSINAHMLLDDGKIANVMDFNDFGQPFAALRNGQVDGVVLDQGTLYGQQEQMHDLRTIGEPIYYHPKPQWAEAEKKAPYILGGTAIGVRKECPDLLKAINTALESMDADGTRKAILTKYGVWADYQAKLMK